jgi:hemoglobin
MKDIENRTDIVNLMNAFYKQALTDETIGYIFTDVAKLDLEHHLPIIADFWEMILFGTVNFQLKYGRSPMQKHLELNQNEPLVAEHFNAWLKLFDSTVDENFAGEKASLVKFRAKAIANTMFMKVSQDSFATTRVGQE